jgi:phospholipase C
MYSGFCALEWSGSCSGSEYVTGIPYGNRTEGNSLFYEDGFKSVRGYLAEGHYPVFESNSYALSNPNNTAKQFEATAATASHDSINQRWVLYGLSAEGTTFNTTSAVDGEYISQHSSLSVSVTGAEVYDITYIGSSQYILQKVMVIIYISSQTGVSLLIRSRTCTAFTLSYTTPKVVDIAEKKEMNVSCSN